MRVFKKVNGNSRWVVLLIISMLILSPDQLSGQQPFHLVPDSILTYIYIREDNSMQFSGATYNYYSDRIIDSTVTTGIDRKVVNKTIYSWSEGVVDELNTYKVVDGSIIPDIHKVFTYDPWNLVQEEFVERWYSDRWMNLNLFKYTYDENSRLKVYNREIWRNSTWSDYSADSLFYDTKGLLTERSARLKETGQYITRILYQYHPSGHKKLQVRQDYINNQWTNITQTTFFYNDCGTQNVSVTDKWIDGTWQPYSRSEIYYHIEPDPGVRRVTVCHKGTTLSVRLKELAAHLSHGDCIGGCVDLNAGVRPRPSGSSGDIPDNQIARKQPFVVFPNPATEYLTLRVTDSACPPAGIELMDYAGRIIRSIRPGDQTEITINLTGLQSGNYILRVTADSLYSTVISKQ